MPICCLCSENIDKFKLSDIQCRDCHWKCCLECMSSYLGHDYRKCFTCNFKIVNQNSTEFLEENNFECLFPSADLCSDNAAMIALFFLKKFKKKLFNELNFKVNPRWQLDETAKFLKGAGVKL